MRASEITFPGVAATATSLALTAMAVLPAFAATAAERGERRETTTELTRVETERVCMVNDAVFENAQIPVEVDDKTYYGCCPMCKERLTLDHTMRTGLDPATGERVDKALAVIAARLDGSVLYFTSEETLAAYEVGERVDNGRSSAGDEGGR